METKICLGQQNNVLYEIIENAVGLPIESQNMILMMAKAMRHTRNEIMHSEAGRDVCETDTESI